MSEKMRIAAKTRDILIFLQQNNTTMKHMNAMWAYMYDKNRVIKNLTDNGKNWKALNTIAMKSLITQYEKQLLIQEPPEGFDLITWYEAFLVAQQLIQ